MIITNAETGMCRPGM